MNLHKVTKIAGALVLLSMTACSNTEKWINQINLDTQEQNGEQFVELSADVDTRALMVSSIAFPILDPNDTAKVVGQLSLMGGLGTGTSKLTVLVKSSLLLNGKIVPSKGLLPNGTMIPVAVSDSKKWMEIPIGAGNTKVYFHLDLSGKKAVLGTAVNLDDLSIGAPINLLMPFEKSGYEGMAGVYTGPVKGQSGFALFVDASTLLEDKASGITPVVKPVSNKVAKKVRDRILHLEQKRIVLKVH